MWLTLGPIGGLVFLFRTTPPSAIAAALPLIEAKMRRFAERALFQHTLSDQQWKIAQLPFSLGGLNFIPLQVLSYCAYLASLLANRDAIVALRPDSALRLDNEIKTVTELLQQQYPSAKLPQLKSTTKQKDLVQAIGAVLLQDILDNSDARTRTLLRCQQQPHASLWKTAAHTAENFMAPELALQALRYCVGMPIFPKSGTCKCCCKEQLDIYGDHAVICMPEGDVVHRHNLVYDLFVQEARAGGIGVKVEHEIFLNHDRSYRADFVTSYGIPGLTERTTCFDLTISCPLNGSNVSQAGRKDLYTAMQAEARKNKKHKENLEQVKYDFIPLAFETTGGHSPNVTPVVHYLLDQKAKMTGIPFNDLASRFWQHLSITLQSANAAAIQRRLKESLDPQTD